MIKNLRTFLLPVFLAFNFSSMSFSQTPKKNEKVVYEKNTKLNFEEKEVDGKFLSPDGKDVKSERTLDFDSLLDPKNSFSKELKRDSGAVR
jgi:hypothetical protein